RDGQARGVGGEDRVLRGEGVELLPQRVLELEVLGDRLNDDVAALQVAGGGREGEPLERGVPFGRGELPLLHELRELLLDPATRALPDLLRHVAHDRLVARGRGDLRDAASHQTAPQHPHPSYLGHASPDSEWGWSTPGRRPG